jgi:hypothetical protein
MEYVIGIIVTIFILAAIIKTAIIDSINNKNNINNKKFAELETSEVGFCAQLIRYALDEKGYVVGEPSYNWSIANLAEGIMCIYQNGREVGRIYYTIHSQPNKGSVMGWARIYCADNRYTTLKFMDGNVLVAASSNVLRDCPNNPLDDVSGDVKQKAIEYGDKFE